MEIVDSYQNWNLAVVIGLRLKSKEKSYSNYAWLKASVNEAVSQLVENLTLIET